MIFCIAGAGGMAHADGIADGHKCATTRNNPDVAINYCVRAIYSGDLSQDQLAATYYNRGLEYKRKGDYGQAIKDFDSAIVLRPDFVRAFNSRGVTYFEMGEHKLAIEGFDAAIEIMPDDASLRRNRGVLRFYRGEFAAAALYLDSALQRNPGEPQNTLWLYVAQDRSGRESNDVLAWYGRNFELNQWPGPVIAMFLGMIGPDVVADIGRKAFEQGDDMRQCQAYFYVGQYQMIRGAVDNAGEFFRAAVATRAVGALEYTGALAELGRIGKDVLTEAATDAN
ncbi:MAG: tetratricopeptide repeat protein [Alphaproteobacteria bacterium]